MSKASSVYQRKKYDSRNKMAWRPDRHREAEGWYIVSETSKRDQCMEENLAQLVLFSSARKKQASCN
jgi:hypothetical protein